MVDKTIHYTCPTGGMCSTPSAPGTTAITWNCGSCGIGCIFLDFWVRLRFPESTFGKNVHFFGGILILNLL